MVTNKGDQCQTSPDLEEIKNSRSLTDWNKQRNEKWQQTTDLSGTLEHSYFLLEHYLHRQIITVGWGVNP